MATGELDDATIAQFAKQYYKLREAHLNQSDNPKIAHKPIAYPKATNLRLGRQLSKLKKRFQIVTSDSKQRLLFCVG